MMTQNNFLLVCDQLLSWQQQALNQQEELASLAQQQNLKGKKLTRAMENYAWNIRMLKGQADLTAQAQQQCQQYFTQVSVSSTLRRSVCQQYFT